MPVKKKRPATAVKAAAAKPRAKKPPAERELVSFDFAVKYLLRGKRDYVVLNGFLSELLGKKVVVKSLEDVENIKDDKDDKTNRVDLKAQIDGGEIVLFEIQFIQEFDFLGRVLFGVSSAIVDQVKEGKFYNIQKVYSVIIAYSNLNAKREYLFSGEMNHFNGVHYKDEQIPFSQAIAPKSKKMVGIHPEYYLILPRMFDEKMRGLFDEWVYILKNSAVRDDFKAAGIKEAKTKLDYLRMTPEQKKAYKRYLEKRRSADSAIQTAEGIGERRGRLEERAKLVKSMYETGLTVAKIVKSTKLSETAVKRILGL
ncbi:MAG: Rpn family recombination-promoting nuclease/putative transposase [Chitinispirillales bacterium]|jgi:predicted transposase/invertase (TIGR01784 family)|nr:Rpn family recombination-promoting nuclease/putative transposase [Chitinispirillales bacterium]